MRLARTIFFPLLATLVFGTPACTRAAETPAREQLATIVAATLAARPTMPPTRTATASPSATNTVAPLPTSTVVVSPSLSPTSTVTPLSFDDPREGRHLEPADQLDDFDNENRWYTFDNADANNKFVDGTLVAIDKKKDILVWWSTSKLSASDFYMEITTRFDQCSGKDAAGIAVRVGGSGFSRGYVFELACDGSFRMRKFWPSNATPLVLVDWTSSGDIHSGSNAANRVGILAEGNKLYVFVNGMLLTEDPIKDSEYAKGVFALFSSAVEKKNLKVTFDKFSFWDLSK